MQLSNYMKATIFGIGASTVGGIAAQPKLADPDGDLTKGDVAAMTGLGLGWVGMNVHSRVGGPKVQAAVFTASAMAAYGGAGYIGRAIFEEITG
jgi:hypothetical protein